MAVDLFSLRTRFEVTGATEATAALRGVDAAGQKVAVSASAAAAALQKMGVSGTVLSNSLGRMGFTTAEVATAMAKLGGGSGGGGGVLPPAVQGMTLLGSKTDTAGLAMRSATGASAAMIAGMSQFGRKAIESKDLTGKWEQGLANLAAQKQRVGFAGQVLNGILGSSLVRYFATTGAIFGLVRGIGAATEAYDNFTQSNLRLDAASKIIGVSHGRLVEISGRLQSEFKLTTATANDLVAAAAKMASRAGDVGQTEPLIRSWLNVAAAQGMGATQAMLALTQTLKGVDDGTDRLFQKNPSQIWKDYAASIGKTAGSLSEQEKWLAIVNETMRAHEKVGDQYERFLDSTLGKQEQLNTKWQTLEIQLGKLINPFRLVAIALGNVVTDAAIKLINRWNMALQESLFLGQKVLSHLGLMRDRGGADPGGVRGDNLGMGANPMDALGPLKPKHVPTREEIAAAKKAREEYIKTVMGLANMDESMRAPDKLDYQGVAASHLALRGGIAPVSGGIGARHQSADDEFMGGSLGGDLESLFAQGGDGKSVEGKMAILAAFANEARRQAVALKVQFATLGQSLGMTLANGFGAALGAAMSGKNVFKAFGGAVLSGLGSIFSQMGQKLVAYGLVMLKLLPFLSNPFTSGPASIAAGIALMGLGAALGGIAHGSGGSGGSGGGSDFRDRTTQITLTANGAGGMNAPHTKVGPVIQVLGKDSPEGQRLFGEHAAAAKRSRNM